MVFVDKYSIFWFYMRNEFFDSGAGTDDEAVEAGHRAVDLGINPRPGRVFAGVFLHGLMKVSLYFSVSLYAAKLGSLWYKRAACVSPIMNVPATTIVPLVIHAKMLHGFTSVNLILSVNGGTESVTVKRCRREKLGD